jgi:serine/threonine protein kinase
MSAERSSSPVGARRRVGDYLLGQTLGAGSFGKVKLATHVTTGEKVRCRDHVGRCL